MTVTITAFERSPDGGDGIFKGTKLGDLPIEQPSKVDLVVNRKTADDLGLKIPRLIWLQAAKVIE
jgi:putative ABC transport system substrate-binding protein